MKNIKFIIGIMALCWLPLSIYGQAGVTRDRSVNFLHGLNGRGTWNGFTTFFSNQEPRRMNINEMGFTSSDGFDVISAEARGQSILAPDAIAICQSMGGVIARRIDRVATTNSTPSYGGIITVGSPLDGAPVANSVSNGDVGRALGDANYALFRGPLASIGWANFSVQFFGNAFGASFLPEFLSGLTSLGNSPATLNDLKVGGTGIEFDKNAAPTNTPKISIWGNEDSPTHWNILDDSKPSGLNFLDAIGGIPTAADALGYAYLAIGITYTVIAAINWYNPYGWYSAYAAYQWYAGYDWIANDSERIYNNLIGSDMIVQQCYQYPTLIYTYPDECDDIPSRWRNCRPTVQTVMATACVQVHNNGISDAFIPAVSQRGDGSRSWKVGSQTVPTREAMHTNHKEELQPESPEMRAIFDEIFRAEPGSEINPVFQINRR